LDALLTSYKLSGTVYFPTRIQEKSATAPTICGLSKKFVQYVYKNFILQVLGYINVVPFKILPIRHNTFVPPLFPLLEAPLELFFS